MGFVLVLAFLSNDEQTRLALKPSIVYIGAVLIVVATIGFILNSRHIKLEHEARMKALEEMRARHEKMLKKYK